MFIAPSGGITKTTTPDAVLPFYIYASLSFLAATILFLLSVQDEIGHHFHPAILAITHIMALGWGTMMIIGVGHQLLPVIAESVLYSIRLAKSTFILAAFGIPLLIYGFYSFDIGLISVAGASLTILALLLYLTNITATFSKGGKWNVHMVFVLTATCWLIITAVLGLLLLINFNHQLLSNESIYYLTFHAHLGIAGWFLLLIIGVGSRLIPMFLISKYTNVVLLWIIYLIVNVTLILFSIDSLVKEIFIDSKIYLITGVVAISLFGYFIKMAYKNRIRKMIDTPMKLSLISVVTVILPPLVLLLNYVYGSEAFETKIALVYGFIIFFGWISSIIFGMTFKTLPFIIWNKVYHNQEAGLKPPMPRELYSGQILRMMNIVYIAGFTGASAGLITVSLLLLKISASLLVVTGLLYNFNVIKILMHKNLNS